MGEIESLDTPEPLARRLDRHAYDRLIMLSDGVFAIAMTLAALDLRLPEGWSGTPRDFWAAAAAPLVSYVISFWVIAGYWTAHRRMLARMTRVDGPFTAIALVLLGWIAVVPAATQLLNRSGLSGFAATLYASVIIGVGATQFLAWGYAAFWAGLVSPEVARRTRVAMLASLAVAPALFLYVAAAGFPHAGGPALAFFAVFAGVMGARRILLRRMGA
jgi:uncharacterized membrane protein